MTTPNQYDGLTVSVRKTAAGDQYVAFVSPGGVEFPIAGVKAEGFEQDLNEVQAARDAQTVADHNAAQTDGGGGTAQGNG